MISISVLLPFLSSQPNAPYHAHKLAISRKDDKPGVVFKLKPPNTRSGEPASSYSMPPAEP
jgi:hypothetical protein